MQMIADGAGESTVRARADGLDHLTQRDFHRLARFIQGYSGIKMPSSKLTMLEGRLRRRVRAIGAGNLADYCRRLFEGGELDGEAVYLIDAVTTNKTEFFREPEHFRILTGKILPDLLTGRKVGSRNPLKVWSAACSTGAEPYTLAMVLAEFGRDVTGFAATVLATDICTEVLDTALRGIYTEEMIRPVPPEIRSRYVRRGTNGSRGLVRIAPEIRSRVQFARLNLMSEEYPVDRDIDVVFCRNILIYFDKPTQEAVLQRLCRHLRAGGYLILGHSETLAGFDLPLQTVAATVFRRV